MLDLPTSAFVPWGPSSTPEVGKVGGDGVGPASYFSSSNLLSSNLLPVIVACARMEGRWQLEKFADFSVEGRQKEWYHQQAWVSFRGCSSGKRREAQGRTGICWGESVAWTVLGEIQRGGMTSIIYL